MSSTVEGTLRFVSDEKESIFNDLEDKLWNPKIGAGEDCVTRIGFLIGLDDETLDTMSEMSKKHPAVKFQLHVYVSGCCYYADYDYDILDGECIETNVVEGGADDWDDPEERTPEEDGAAVTCYGDYCKYFA